MLLLPTANMKLDEPGFSLAGTIVILKADSPPEREGLNKMLLDFVPKIVIIELRSAMASGYQVMGVKFLLESKNRQFIMKLIL